jgi:hypothetical protein
MPGLDPGIHVLGPSKRKTWMAGTKPGHDEKRILFKLLACNPDERSDIR